MTAWHYLLFAVLGALNVVAFLWVTLLAVIYREKAGLLDEVGALLERALPFVGPRHDYADRGEGSFSELIRASLIKEELEEALTKIKGE